MTKYCFGTMIKMSRKTNLIILLLSSGFIAVIVGLLMLQSGMIGVTDFVYRLAYFALISLGLVIVYYLKTGGSEKQLRAFWTIIVAVMFAFPFAVVCWVIARALLVQPDPNLYVPLYFAGLALGALIGYRVSRGKSKQESSDLFPEES